MKVLFICPAVSTNYKQHIKAIALKGWKDTRFFKRDIKRNERSLHKTFYGLGLLSLTSYLPKEIQFTFIDENTEKVNYPTLLKTNKFDLVAITAQLIQSKRAIELIHYFSSRGIYVVVGGPHPTTFPELYAINNDTSIFLGEGEYTFKSFLEDFMNRMPKPVYHQIRNEYVDMSRLLATNFSIISKNRYNFIGVQTTRGCPYKCRFCSVSTISGNKYRHKSIEQICDEIKQVKKYWPESNLLFFDDNTFADTDFAFSLFEALKNIDLGNWICQSDISISQQPELLDLVASNGHPFFSFGFETLSDKNVKTINNKMKEKFISKYESCIKKLQSKGIVVGGSFIFGFSGDTESDLNDIMEFIHKTNINGYVTIYTAIPGCKLYDDILYEYEQEVGDVKEKKTEQIKRINQYLMRKNNFDLLDTEDMIIKALRRRYSTKIPMLAIDSLAVYRAFLDIAV